jgi:hypothetical protein
MLENLQTLTLDTDPMNTKFTTTKEVMAAPPVPMDNRPKVQVEANLVVRMINVQYTALKKKDSFNPTPGRRRDQRDTCIVFRTQTGKLHTKPPRFDPLALAYYNLLHAER